MTNQEKISLYLSIFRGRTDVYPRRWEKNGKSGWSPAYSFDWNKFNFHRANGGTIKNFEHKTLIPFTEDVLYSHLFGKGTIGIYPILQDNTSYFIVADFDEGDWKSDCQKFVDTCKCFSLDAYTEISRSGNGGHVWVFFEEKYPCWKSRKIILEIIKKTFGYSEFSKEVSFDRLFPNQDVVTIGGFGNLIALPLQGERVLNRASVFCDSKTFIPFSNQWEFLKTIHRHSYEELDFIYNMFFEKIEGCVGKSENKVSKSNYIKITIDGLVYLKKSSLSSKTNSFLKDKLNIFNREYAVKKKLGKPVFKTERYFNLIKDIGEEIIIPRGFLTELKDFLNEEGLRYKIVEKYKKIEQTKFHSTISLNDDQAELLKKIEENTSGIIVAPPGSGKTIVALELVAKLGVPALILTNRNQILSQWIDRTQQFLGIPKTQIGVISGTKKKVGKQITVATFQSLVRYKKIEEIVDSFGVIIVDECHHIPAKTYREIVGLFRSKYFFGLTATHKRKYGNEKITELVIGSVVAEMSDENKETKKKFKIDIHPTNLSIPFCYSTDTYEVLAKMICYDSSRNKQIREAVFGEVRLKRKILVLTERKEHIEILKLYFGKEIETISISGDDSMSARKIKMSQIHSGNFQVLIATGQLLGEGFDLHGVDSIVLAFPLSFEGKLAQYIGRLRGDGLKTVIDFRDEKIPFLEQQFKKRHRFYKGLLK